MTSYSLRLSATARSTTCRSAPPTSSESTTNNNRTGVVCDPRSCTGGADFPRERTSPCGQSVRIQHNVNSRRPSEAVDHLKKSDTSRCQDPKSAIGNSPIRGTPIRSVIAVRAARRKPLIVSLTL